MIRTSVDIEAEIQAVKNEIQNVKAANVNWITDPVIIIGVDNVTEFTLG
jgi:hypothetical protein